MRIRFPANQQVAAVFGGFTVLTDQSREAGGEGAAPSPFELFLASIGACAGFFVLSFCRKRGIPTGGIELRQTAHYDELAHRVRAISIEIALPASFPEKYRDSVVAAVNSCTVKRHLLEPPEFEVRTVPAGEAPGA